jgi:hypothetical protein
MNWYKKYKTSGYSSELGYLKNYLKQGFNPEDYSHKIKDYLETLDPEEVYLEEGWEDLESYDILDNWLKSATQEDKNNFERYIAYNYDGWSSYDEPAYTVLNFRKLAKPQWLVHFTEDAQSIKNNGFIYGHEEFTGLHLTTYKSDKARKSEPGYNFAFQTGSRDARGAERQDKYGKECVVFYGAAVQVDHSGDEETQMIFWGPAINKDMIFVMVKTSEGEWCVPSYVKDCVVKGNFEDCCTWVENNYRTLQQIEQKSRNIMREKDMQRKKRLEKENLTFNMSKN